ncbi:MAG: 4-hydroxy-3-methylbut-2-enyl diphosphate reductase [Propionibacteriaceae bacterium]|jgi:4-hydroxy-3-methylbut-2-enyl diphosphate reductase|nr:4-hydroxy-3-methylbut-2-enyl diphosphate reductase [Propionibacteriaceae bacterium]
MTRRVLLAAPRGYCAGVDRAVACVELALQKWGAPVYVRKQIVHNAHVVASSAARGAVFVDELTQVPEGAVCLFSAHGVSPAVRDEAASRNLLVIDATCPLVTKVHNEARRFAAQGLPILLIGHAGHEEVEGTMGEVPDMRLIETPADVATLDLPDDAPVAWLSQTTLSVDETRETVASLKSRFANLVSPPSEDLCYATQNRQAAVRSLAHECDVVLVVGSANSSNSVRLVEVALDSGAGAAYRVDAATDIDPAWLAGAQTVGVTSGASVPEELVAGVLARLTELGWPVCEEHRITTETLSFVLPAQLREGQ